MQYKKVQKSSWNEPYSSSSFTKQSCINYCGPCIGKRNIAISVSVCLPACVSQKLHIRLRQTPNFQYMLPVAVACSSSDDNTLPVSWITSHLHTMARNRRHEKGVYSNWLTRGSIGSERSLVYNTTALFRCWRKSLQSFFYSVLTLKNAIGFTGFPLSYNSTYNAYLSKPAADGPWRSQRYCW